MPRKKALTPNSEQSPSLAEMERVYSSIKEILESARNRAYQAVNAEMVQAYWQIGKVIVEEEQNGKQRAEYGKSLLKAIANRLTEEYGKGFTEQNLRYVRTFYLLFPKWNAVRSELSWTHYRILIKVKDEKARLFYQQQAIDCRWTYRELERQIGVQLFERTNLSRVMGKELVDET